MDYTYLLNPSALGPGVEPGDIARETWGAEELRAHLEHRFRGREGAAEFRGGDLREEITRLTLGGSREVYVWDEMNKMSEMFFIAQQQPLPGPVLDLCCGYGYWITKILRRIDLGVDLFPDAGRYKRTPEGMRDRGFIDDTYQAVLKCDVTRPMPIPDASIGTVLCICALEHIAEPDKVLAEVRRILKPGGKCLLTIDAPPLLDVAGEVFHPDYVARLMADHQLENIMPLEGWQEMLPRHGLRVDRLAGYIDRVRAFLYLTTFYPAGYDSLWSRLGLTRAFREHEPLRRFWNAEAIPWLTAEVDPKEAMLLCFACTREG